MAIQTLTGGEFYSGSALSNAQGDQVEVDGLGNTIWEQFGNLTVNSNSTPATDSNTAIALGGKNVTDTMTIGGGNNFLSSPFGYSPLVAATVSYTVTGSTGNNAVNLNNKGGRTTLAIQGSFSAITLNGDATNSVTLGAAPTIVPDFPLPDITTHNDGNSVVAIGSWLDDDLFGNNSAVNFYGANEKIVGGDENFTIADLTYTGPLPVPPPVLGTNFVAIGDGSNAVTLQGTHNVIITGGGNNVLDAGSSNAFVWIQGTDHGVPDPTDLHDPDLVPAVATDSVTIRGANDGVSAGNQNVTILGAGVTTAATIQLGNGTNNITLGGNGGDNVAVGTGNNTVTATGNGSQFVFGDGTHAGTNSLTLSGNGNLAIFTDVAGTGTDTVALGTGVNNQIYLYNATGVVTGTGLGVNYVTQSGPNGLTVILGNGTGNIQGGDGNDFVTANGDGTRVVLGKGNDSITANGNGAYIHTSDVKASVDTVIANGNGDQIYMGDGTDTVTAMGTGDVVIAGNGNDTVKVANGSYVKLGNGNNTITGGNGDVISVGTGSNTITVGSGPGIVSLHAGPTSENTVTVGGLQAVYQQGGILHVNEPTSNAGGDAFFLNGLLPESSMTILGNNDLIAFGQDSSCAVTLNPSVTGEVIQVAGDNAPAPNGAIGDYTGNLTISGFGLGQTMDLEGLIGGIDHNVINSFSEVLANLNPSTPNNTIVLASGAPGNWLPGGSIAFLNPTALSPTEFAFSGNTVVPLPV